MAEDGRKRTVTRGRLHGIGECSRERFAEHYCDVGRREGALRDPKPDLHRFVIRDGDDTHELAYVYERYLALPGRARRHFLLSVFRRRSDPPPVTNPPSWEQVAPRLMPRLRSGGYLDLARLHARQRGYQLGLCHRRIADGLHLTLVIDSDVTMMNVTRSMLQTWDRTFEQAAEQASSNLSLVSSETLVPLSDGLWVAPWDDAYAASRLLLDGVADELCARPILAIPNRDTLLVADSSRPSSIEALVLAIDDVAEERFPLTRSLYRRHPSAGVGELERVQLGGDDGVSLLHRNLCTSEQLRRYAEQQWPLQEALGDDVYVAGAEADEARDGLLVSRALWTQHVDTLLPEVDRIQLLPTTLDGTSSRFWVASFAALRSLPGALERTDHHLARWRTGEFPTDEQLRAIANPLERDRRTAELESQDDFGEVVE